MFLLLHSEDGFITLLSKHDTETGAYYAMTDHYKKVTGDTMEEAVAYFDEWYDTRHKAVTMVDDRTCKEFGWRILEV